MAVMRDEHGRFMRGSVANPGGRSKLPDDVRQMLRDAAPEAVKTIIRRAREGDVKCAIYICDRVLGKPTQPMELELETEIAQPLTLDQMRDLVLSLSFGDERSSADA